MTKRLVIFALLVCAAFLQVRKGVSRAKRFVILALLACSIALQAQQSFNPVPPCRVVDTRQGSGPFGAPDLAAGTRDFPIPAGACSIPATASAFSLNLTVITASGTLDYLTIWPTGAPRPNVSTLNGNGSRIIVNAAIVPAGTGGSVSVFVTQEIDLLIDINGYFSPAATSGGGGTGPAGPQGPQGVAGAQGPAGNSGPPGPMGIQGTVGATGGNIPPNEGTGIAVAQVLDVNGNPIGAWSIAVDQLVVPTWVSPPVTSSDHCSANQFSYDKTYYYFCSPDGWNRITAVRGW
jgi:hypothetical protein